MGFRWSVISSIYARVYAARERILWIAKILDSSCMWPVNAVIRSLFLSVARLSFRRWKVEGFAAPRWVLRNSAVNLRSYNPLVSDLDFSAVLPLGEGSLLIAQASAATRFYQRVKQSCLPMLGELEVYTQRSISDIERIDAQLSRMGLGKFSNLVRSIRKIRWMQALYENATGDFERYKYARSIRFCTIQLRALGVSEGSISQILSSGPLSWEVIAVAVPASWRMFFTDLNVPDGRLENPYLQRASLIKVDALGCSLGDLVLASLTPLPAARFSIFSETLARLRSVSDLGCAFRLLAHREAEVYRAHLLGRLDVAEGEWAQLREFEELGRGAALD
jgi:hypothetical protein